MALTRKVEPQHLERLIAALNAWRWGDFDRGSLAVQLELANAFDAYLEATGRVRSPDDRADGHPHIPRA